MRVAIVVIGALLGAVIVAAVADGWRGFASALLGLGIGLGLIALLTWAQIADAAAANKRR